jgi:glycosyltransferase involved in cell wall biosynthesis
VIPEINEVTRGQAEILIVDGSNDDTPNIARKLGATVIQQAPRGYGIAVKKAILSANRKIVVTMDADHTYPTEYIPELIKWIYKGFDVVSASRMKGYPKNMTFMNIFGNKLLALLGQLLMLRRFHDATTGMRAYKRELLHRIDWTENTGLSAELLIRPVILGYKVKEINIPYRERLGVTKLPPWSGGISIAKSILKYGLWKRS